MAAAAKYAHEDVAEDGARPLKVCAEAGRKCVRNIHQYPVLSMEWIQLVDSLKQLTRLVQLEGRMPENTKVSETLGRDDSTGGTLWDQGAHENAIRILVEEAKVNLCLRMMNEYKKWQYNLQERMATMQEAMQVFEFSENQLEQKCIQYEESLGLLLWRSFTHVETLQLMDIPLVIDHCAMVVETVQKMKMEPTTKMQETIVLYYFACLMKHAEELNNAELLAKVKEYRLVMLTVVHVLTYYEKFDSALMNAVADGFSDMANNEDFATEWKSFFGGAEEMQLFLQLEDKIVAPILQANPERKRELRPLLDLFRKMERSL
jgi:hypothetical protein